MKRVAWFLVPFLVVAGCALALDAGAQTACPTDPVASDAARVCWRNATELESGAPIPATGELALKYTQVARGTCTATTSPTSTAQTVTVPAANGSTLFDGLPAGVHCFRARHGLNSGTVGGWTAWARKTTAAPAPAKPKQPNITVE